MNVGPLPSDSKLDFSTGEALRAVPPAVEATAAEHGVDPVTGEFPELADLRRLDAAGRPTRSRARRDRRGRARPRQDRACARGLRRGGWLPHRGRRMSLRDCIAAVRQASGDKLTDEEALELLEEVERRRADSRRKP